MSTEFSRLCVQYGVVAERQSQLGAASAYVEDRDHLIAVASRSRRGTSTSLLDSAHDVRRA